MKTILKYLCLFCLGGVSYYLIETIYRHIVQHGAAHWTMVIIGGLSLVIICSIDNYTRLPIITKALLSGCIITLMEFILGYIYTYILHNPLWTYATADFMGIISFTWSLLWCGISLIILIIKKTISTFTKQND